MTAVLALSEPEQGVMEEVRLKESRRYCKILQETLGLLPAGVAEEQLTLSSGETHTSWERCSSEESEPDPKEAGRAAPGVKAGGHGRLLGFLRRPPGEN